MKHVSYLFVCLLILFLFNNCQKEDDTFIVEENYEAQIKSLKFSGHLNFGTFENDSVIIIKGPFNEDSLKSLVPIIAISEGATIEPSPGVETDFTNPVLYKVTAQDGTQKRYIVSVIPTFKKALIIIDVQNGYFPVHNTEIFLENINILRSKSYEANMPVIYVQQMGDLPEDSYSWQIHGSIAPHEGDFFVEKYYGDAFYETNLINLCDSLGVYQLIITGLASNGCVHATIFGSLKLGYHLIVAKDAHTTTTVWPDYYPESYNSRWEKIKHVEVLSTSEITF